MEALKPTTPETTPQPERPRTAWRKIGHKFLNFFQSKPKPTSTLAEPPSDISTTTPSDITPAPDAVSNDTPHTEPDKFHEPTTADELALVREMEIYRSRQKDLIRGERAQEIREQEFNAKLTPIAEIAAAVNGDTVSLQYEPYQGRQIPVYTLAGYPFRFLQHVIDFKLTPNNDTAIGYNTAQRLLDDPALWMRPASEVATGSKNADQEADTVSTSYIDTDTNVTGGARDKHGVTYGFLSMPPDSVIGLYGGDGATSGKAGQSKPTNYDLAFSPDELARYSTHLYNEVLRRRYDEQGQPIPPDCLIVHNGAITEATKRHAAYFGVPIINIEDQPYLEQQKSAFVQQVDSIDDHSTYDQIFQVLQTADQSALGITAPWKTDIYSDQANYQLRSGILPPVTTAKFQEIVNTIEPAKRLTLLNQEITRLTSELSKAKGPDKYKINNPFYVARHTRFNRQHSAATYDPRNFVDSLSIQYIYQPKSGKRHSIQTTIDSTDPTYTHFSKLIDAYAQSGGTVHDERVQSPHIEST